MEQWCWWCQSCSATEARTDRGQRARSGWADTKQRGRGERKCLTWYFMSSKNSGVKRICAD